MEHYEFAFISPTDHGESVQITDSAELEYLLSEVKKYYPKMTSSGYKLPDGSLYGCELRNLSGQDRKNVRWYLIKLLCSRGWEPLGAVPDVYGTSNFTNFCYQFKHKVIG